MYLLMNPVVIDVFIALVKKDSVRPNLKLMSRRFTQNVRVTPKQLTTSRQGHDIISYI